MTPLERREALSFIEDQLRDEQDAERRRLLGIVLAMLRARGVE